MRISTHSFSWSGLPSFEDSTNLTCSPPPATPGRHGPIRSYDAEQAPDPVPGVGLDVPAGIPASKIAAVTPVAESVIRHQGTGSIEPLGELFVCLFADKPRLLQIPCSPFAGSTRK